MLQPRHPLGGRPLDRQTLALWRQSPRGQRMLDLERSQLEHFLPDVFGRHVLQIGNWGEGNAFVASSGTLHHAVVGSVADGAGVIADPQQLPVLSKSVDAVVLPHTLEFHRWPHHVLREIDRVLNDRGRLFVLGFNPWGMWAWRGRLGLRHRSFPPSGRFFSVGRVTDWLELLNFEVIEVRRYGTGFPWLAPHRDGQAWSPGSLLAPLAEAYLIVARKRVLPMNFVGRVQRAQIKPLVGIGLPAAQRDALDGGDAPPG